MFSEETPFTSWLHQQGLRGTDCAAILRGLCERLLDAKLDLDRVVIGYLVHHPQFDGVNFIWERGASEVKREIVKRQEILQLPSPFLEMQTVGIQELRYSLEGNGALPFRVLERLQSLGFTDYQAFFKPFGTSVQQDLWHELPKGLTLQEGVYSSFATKRPGGFGESEIEQLRTLTSPLAIAVKVGAVSQMAETLLGAYLGPASGDRVLRGHVRRGQGSVIDAMVWYSDLRRSTELAKAEGLDIYLDTLNSYYDCVVEAVLKHGGEVLKFVGDGLLAMFAFEPGFEEESKTCQRALSAVRTALDGLETSNADRRERGLAEIQFGVALHAGEVMYGNVGSPRRLDFTVTGPTVNEVVRLEKLCKKLRIPLVFSEPVATLAEGVSSYVGRHLLPGIRPAMPVFSLSDLRAFSQGQSARIAKRERSRVEALKYSPGELSLC